MEGTVSYKITYDDEELSFKECSHKRFAFAIVCPSYHETFVNPLFISDISDSRVAMRFGEMYDDLAIVKSRDTGSLPKKIDFIEQKINVGFVQFAHPVTNTMARAFVEELDLMKRITCVIVPVDTSKEEQQPTWGRSEDFCSLVYFYKWDPRKAKKVALSREEDTVVTTTPQSSPERTVLIPLDEEEEDEENPLDLDDGVQYQLAFDEKRGAPYIITRQRTTDEVNRSIDSNFKAFKRMIKKKRQPQNLP